VLGDNQYNSGAFNEYTAPQTATYVGGYDVWWGPFNSIVHPVPGNHEYDTSGASGYFQYFGSAIGGTNNGPDGDYSLNVGSWHVIALNSNCSDSGCRDLVGGPDPSQPQTKQLNWLNSDLASDDSACTLAIWHHPRFSAGWTQGSPGVGPLWTALYSAHADVVLNGHDHIYERYAQLNPSGAADPNGMREFVVGTGGESLNGYGGPALGDPAPETYAQNYGVLKLTLHANYYTWAFINTSGGLVDSGTQGCHGQGAAVAAAPAAARDVAEAHVPALIRRSPQFDFAARPITSSLGAVIRNGLPVAVHCSRMCDVTVDVSLRRGHRLQRIARFYETESEIPKPYSRIVLSLPARRLRGLRHVTLVLRFAALDAAFHHRVVTRIVHLK
jgi:hypothetical protein